MAHALNTLTLYKSVINWVHFLFKIAKIAALALLSILLMINILFSQQNEYHGEVDGDFNKNELLFIGGDTSSLKIIYWSFEYPEGTQLILGKKINYQYYNNGNIIPVYFQDAPDKELFIEKRFMPCMHRVILYEKHNDKKVNERSFRFKGHCSEQDFYEWTFEGFEGVFADTKTGNLLMLKKQAGFNFEVSYLNCDNRKTTKIDSVKLDVYSHELKFDYLNKPVVCKVIYNKFQQKPKLVVTTPKNDTLRFEKIGEVCTVPAETMLMSFVPDNLLLYDIEVLQKLNKIKPEIRNIKLINGRMGAYYGFLVNDISSDNGDTVVEYNVNTEGDTVLYIVKIDNKIPIYLKMVLGLNYCKPDKYGRSISIDLDILEDYIEKQEDQ